jgi:hypothetical protein
MANGRTWNPNTRLYESIDYDRKPDMNKTLNSSQKSNNANTVSSGVIDDCKKCKYCQHEKWLYGYVCRLSNKFLMSEKNLIIDKPEWCELNLRK